MQGVRVGGGLDDENEYSCLQHWGAYIFTPDSCLQALALHQLYPAKPKKLISKIQVKPSRLATTYRDCWQV